MLTFFNHKILNLIFTKFRSLQKERKERKRTKKKELERKKSI